MTRPINPRTNRPLLQHELREIMERDGVWNAKGQRECFREHYIRQ